MAGFGVVWEGVGAFKEAIVKTQEAAERATFEATAEGGELIRSAAVAQAPMLTGELRHSIEMEGPEEGGALGFAVEVGPTAIYGRKIELSQPHANPYLARGFAEAAPRLNEIYTKHWARAL